MFGMNDVLKVQMALNEVLTKNLKELNARIEKLEDQVAELQSNDKKKAGK